MAYESIVPKLNRLISTIPRNHPAFKRARNPFDVFDELKEEPVTSDRLYTGIALAKILRHKPTSTPLNLQRIINQTNRYYPALCEHDTNFVRRQLQQCFEVNYREQEADLSVYDVEGKHATILVSSPKDVQFKTSLPFSYFGRDPYTGDKYKGIVWDLFGYWFGVSNLKYNGSAIREWTPKQKARFIKSLKKIKFGPRIEREGTKEF